MLYNLYHISYIEDSKILKIHIALNFMSEKSEEYPRLSNKNAGAYSMMVKKTFWRKLLLVKNFDELNDCENFSSAFNFCHKHFVCHKLFGIVGRLSKTEKFVQLYQSKMFSLFGLM